MYTPTGKNLMLNALTLGTASLHTAFPGPTGLNEVSGGSPAYARQTIAASTASGGARTMTSSPTFDVPPTTVRWFGFYDLAGNFIAMVPNGGAPIEFVVDLAAGNIRSPGHLLTNGMKATAYGGTVPPPLVEGTTYFVVGATTDTFQLAATAGGAPITLTGVGTSGAQISPIVEDVYSSQGQHVISSGVFGLNF